MSLNAIAPNAGPAERLASLLKRAYRGAPIEAAPADALILSPHEAYRVQKSVVEGIGRIVGWKVGRKTSDGERSRAPLLETRFYSSGAVLARDAFRVWALEAELAFRLSRDLPPIGRPYRREEVVAAIGELVVVFEIIDSRYAAWPQVEPMLALADSLSHGAMVVGSVSPPPFPAWLEEAPVLLTIDGRTIVEQRGGNSAGDIIELVARLADDLAQEGGQLRAGDLVTTGSCTGVQILQPGGVAEATFAGLGTVKVARGA